MSEINYNEIGEEAPGPPQENRTCLEEIARWKVDAKLEDSKRYFFHLNEAKQIISGEKCYIIGRKGSGKTAISEYIRTMRGQGIFCASLTFKNFPFNDLYELRNARFPRPHQHISIMKYLIYTYICKLMLNNDRLPYSALSPLRRLYGEASELPLARLLPRWTANNFQVSILNNSFSVRLKGLFRRAPENLPWVEKVDILEDFIRKNIDDGTYFVVFDELDEDYRELSRGEEKTQYFEFLTGLFKATQDIKATFSDTKFKIFPIILLRDDIYDGISDVDKNKWSDFRIHIEWDAEKIKKLLAFRLSRAADPTGHPLPFSEAWRLAFRPGVISSGRRKEEIFDFITRSTQLRPRDYIFYIKTAAESELHNGNAAISPRAVPKVDTAFSNHLRNELIDEMTAVLPDIRGIFSVMSYVAKQIFSFSEFSEVFQKRLKDGLLTTKDPVFAAQILFHFSVIGYQESARKLVFRYNNKDAELDFTSNFVVHRGLFKALQIF